MKKVYSISYDLNKSGKDYEGLIAAIKSYGTWCTPTKSYWLVVTTGSAKDIYNKLKPHLDNDDRIFIQRVMGDNAGWMSKQLWEWVNNNVPAAVPA